MDPELQVICAQHGVFRRCEAEALGYDDHTIARRVKDGSWHRVRWGAYCDGNEWRDLDARARYALLCRAAYRGRKTEMVLSHTSSANEWAAPLWEADLGTVHLTRPDGRAARREAGIAPHRGRIEVGDVVVRNGLFVMNPTRTALELTTERDVEHSMVEIDDLLRRGLTTRENLHSRFELMNHWPDTLHTDLVLRLVDGRSESVGETRLRYLCWAQGVPAPIPNYPIRDRSGRVVHRVDFAWPSRGVFVEFDGKEKYTRHLRQGESVVDCVLREKRRERLICELTGWRCLRVEWADLYRPAETAAAIRALFRPPHPHRSADS